MKTIDFHTHVGESIFGYGQTVEGLLSKMDALAIEQAVICPVKPMDYHLEPQNDFIAQQVKLHSERLIGFCRVDPRLKEKAQEELRRCIEDLKLSGLFLHPWEETFPINADYVKELMKTVRELKIPVMLSGGHVRVSRAQQISDLASSFPA